MKVESQVGIDGNTRGVDALADSMCSNTRLIELDLRYNRLADAHMPAFAKIMKVHRGLTSLLLSWNHDITDVGGRVILDAIKTNYTLKNL